MTEEPVMSPEELQLHLTIIKLVVTSQVLVELIDDVEGTSMYRQDIKFHAKNLSKRLLKTLDATYKFIEDPEKEETYSIVERGYRKLLNTTVNELFDIGEV